MTDAAIFDEFTNLTNVDYTNADTSLLTLQSSSISLSSSDVTLTYNGSNVENSYSYNDDGKVSCESSNPTKVTCNVDTTNHKIILSP